MLCIGLAKMVAGIAIYHSPSAALRLVTEGLPAVLQVCGYCSTEQKLGERCQNCDKRIARNAVGSLGAPSRHWEVGQSPSKGSLLEFRRACHTGQRMLGCLTDTCMSSGFSIALRNYSRSSL